MDTPAEVTSIRIISVDHYQNTPVNALDPCVSKFRGSDIKQIPVIRIFGSTQNGDKICIHVHGVLPYIYIPYDSTISKSDHDRFVYQIVASLEKALNISMGQSSGKAQHIYDVVHVKGIPFYGYHPKEHQFLKIQFYNPYLTKKAASLLQNAAICGRVLQSFESHIPYILQFFMDYNLYGMSFVHIKTANIAYRVHEAGDESILRTELAKTTRCKLEADIVGANILNYLSYSQTNKLNQNPGINFLWEDEINRRIKLGIPDSVDLPKTQDRPKATPTESDLYFKAVLSSKLDNQNVSMKSTKKTGGKFNLPGLLGNAVYPAECPEDEGESILNASCLPHLVKSSYGDNSQLSFLDDTQVDEELVLSLSQRPKGTQEEEDSFDEDDLSLLNILEELENNQDPIDEDSILAPLTQKPSSNPISQTQLNRSQRLNPSQNISICGQSLPSDDDEEEDDSLNALNMTLMNTQCQDTSIEKDNSVDHIPQLDGITDDAKFQSSLKNEINFEPKLLRSGKKSRYAPLNITVKSSPKKAKLLLKCKSEADIRSQSQPIPESPMSGSPLPRKSPRAMKCLNYSQARPKRSKVDSEANWKEQFNIKDCSVVLDKVDSTPSPTELPISLIYDIENGITAEPGPSSRKTPVKKGSQPMITEHLPVIPSSQEKEPQSMEKDPISDSESDGPGLESFYDKTLCFNGSCSDIEPFSISMSLSLPTPTPTPQEIENTDPEDAELIRITPKVEPPEPEFVRSTYTSYGFLDRTFEKPFFSDPQDVTKKRDIGGVLLEVKAKNYCEPFQSLLGSSFSVSKNISQKELLKKVRITPYREPPLKKDAQQWLRAREKVQQKEKSTSKERVKEPLAESPVKMKRERTIMVLDGDEMDTQQPSGLIFIDDPNLSLDTSLRAIDLNCSVIDTTPEAIQTQRRARHLSSQKMLSSQKNRKKSLRTSAARKLDLSTTIREDVEAFGIKPLSSQSQTSTETTSQDSLLKDKNYLNLTSLSFRKDESQFSQPSLNNTYGFKMDLENLNDVKVNDNHNHLIIFSLEVHCQTREKLLPDPEHDSMSAVFYAISNDSEPTDSRPANVNGVIMVQQEGHPDKPALHGVKVNGLIVESELKLIEKLIEIIQNWDPDILAGYEIELSSWGYLIARAQTLAINVPSQISRVILKKHEEAKQLQTAAEDFDEEFHQQLKIHGRIVLDVWRLLRSEINLMSYTFENIMYHIMHRRYPKHSHVELTKWWKDPRTSWIVMQYYVQRSRGTLEILDQLDLVGRTCELAKLFGIQFFEVLSRGSQFRVESMMLRMAKPRNFIPISPSVQQRVHMRAPEYLPLILEPESRLYVDPVIVLDFQSLYPSMMMAYNYCFSTCLGRVEHLGDKNPFEFGASQLQVSPKILKQLLKRDLITVSPAGIAFVKSEVREGTVPRMVKEILDTRIMVKNSMKLHKDNKLLQRVLHSRQLGLKLIANVTYGYSAANFSGRMSCVEVADSILSKARETLERAIKLVDTNNKWNVKVVYGDTDSLFVQVPGRTKEEAFAIGEEIAQLITEDNPNPVKLKLEKVYQPCILQTKKRYVGFMYETKDQKEPVYEAKGIETVRRDGCPIVARMLEKVLRLLFETKDVSLIKQYVNREFTKIIGGKVNIMDLTFGKEFRGMNGYKPNASVPALQLTRKWKQTDRRREPRSGERVPYVIANGSPGLPLIKLVRSPDELLADEGLKINSFYYILKAIIPPLNRCLLLIGVDVNNWFDELRRNNLLKFEDVVLTKDVLTSDNPKKRSTISQYFSNTDCIIGCGRQSKKRAICEQCKKQPQKVSFVLNTRMQSIERKFRHIEQICQSCCGRQNETQCSSLDCPILFVRTKRERKYQQLDHLKECLDLL